MHRFGAATVMCVWRRPGWQAFGGTFGHTHRLMAVTTTAMTSNGLDESWF